MKKRIIKTSVLLLGFLIILNTNPTAAYSTKAFISNFNSDDIFAIRLSMDEALANAIRHGNKKDETKKINLRYAIDPERVDIYITDEGDGFDPEKVPDPTTQENLEIPNGRGIMLMRAYMNKVEYNKKGNVLRIVKFNSSGQNG